MKDLDFESPEFKKNLDEFVNKMVKEEEDKVKYAYEKREMLFPKISQYILDKSTNVDAENLAYFPENYPFTSYEFNTIFDLIMEYIDNDFGYAIDEDNIFENKSYYLRYKDTLYEFFIMHGQGTATIIRLVDDEDKDELPSELIGDFDGWLSYIKERYNNLDKKS